MTHIDSRLKGIIAAAQLPTPSQLYVNGNVPQAALQTGTQVFPFKTIQQGIDVLIPRGASPLATVRAVDRINVAAGDYDEDLFIDLTNRRLEIVGKFNLGVFDQSQWKPVGAGQASPRRNINITGDVNGLDLVLCSLVIASDVKVADLAESTFTSYNGPRISGAIISTMTNSNAVGRNWFLSIQAYVFGTLGNSTGLSIDCTGDQTAGGPAIPNLQITGSDLEGQINLGVNGRFTDVDMSIIEGDVTAAFFGRASQCRCKADWTITVAQAFGGTPVNGFINCRFDNAFTWTGPHDFYVDAFSNAQAKAAPVSIPGPAVKIITGDTTA